MTLGRSLPVPLVRSLPRAHVHRVVLTPHAGEMASLMGVSKDDVEREPVAIMMRAAQWFGAVVVLKSAESWIATPDGHLYRYAGWPVALATSGSGDTVAGIVAGLATRGAPAVRAVVWGTYLHGAAGRR